MVKPKPRHSSSNKTHRFPEFFKIYIPQLCSQRLRIPPAFIMNFNGVLPLNIVLHSHGISWRISGKTVNNHFFLEKGWPEFVKHNDIESADVLLFSYVGRSEFHVRIFGKNACKKEVPYITDLRTTECSMSLIKDKANAEAATFFSVHPFFQVVLNNSYLRGNYLRLARGIQKHMKRRRSTCELHFSNKSWVVNLTVYDSNNLQFSGGLGLFFKENNLQIGDRCILELMDKDNYVFNVHISRRLN